LLGSHLLFRAKEFHISRGNKVIQEGEADPDEGGPGGISKIESSSFSKIASDLNAIPTFARGLDRNAEVQR
jgi:hypothetical protein